ncbi:MAG: DUF2130 domain-containing protein, partial [Candidatus Bipolaricaulia bacterium]
MHEIKCPSCGTTFSIDEAGYAEILSQVRDEAFDRALQDRLALAEEDKRTAVELAEAKAASEKDKEAVKKDAEIARLEEKLKSAEVAGKLALREALADVERERDDLRRDLKVKDAEQKSCEVALKEKYETQI